MTFSYFLPNQGPPLHPRIKHWKSLLTQQDVSRVRVELYRPRDGILRRPPRIFLKSGDNILEEVPWELELDQWLVEAKIKAVDEKNEGERFGFLMGHAMKPIVREFGSDFFDHVLRQHLQNGPYKDEEAIQKVLYRGASVYTKREESNLCEQQIKDMFSGFAGQLEAMYDGDRETAERIFIQAIVAFLDERFHVTESRMLGLG